MLKILTVVVFSFLPLYAQYLKKVYFVPTNDINLSIITKDRTNDVTIGTIQRDRYLKRMRSKDVLAALYKYGYRHFKAERSYVTFLKLSPVDTTPIKKALEHFYKKSYTQINIHSIHVIPKKHIEHLPSTYTFKIQPRSTLLSHATCSIKSPGEPQIFFDYFIDADVYVLRSKRKIKKGETLNGSNLKGEYVKLDKFRALPIQHFAGYQAKHHINKNRIVTQRDIQKLDFVHRGEMVTVILQDNGLEIQFSAKALQAGTLNDIIVVQNEKAKKFKAKVIGKSLVEVEPVK